jgi:centromere/kinetochore protein ZW10
VSEHVFSVLKIVKETIEEASTVGNDMTFCGNDTFVGSGGSGGQLPLELTCVVRSVMDMYCDVLVNYHKDSLRQLPQHAAFALTNTMYLSHACLILTLEAKARLPKEVISQGLSFADLVAKLRAVGVAVFQEQMRLQRDQLKAIIAEIELASCSGEAHLPPQAEKCLKQVLHQLNHLQVVWSSVLPQSVYCRSIGIILNSVVEELVAKVLALEDIAADSATEISSLLSLLEDRAPQVYEQEENQKSTSRHMVNKYVKSWLKLKQLIFVLNAGLKEIEERWADGKGPLANEFSAEDMKHIIRALFQNTDRRAAVLAKIRYE